MTWVTLIPSAPDGTFILKWDESTQQYSQTAPTFIEGYGWYFASETLDLGKGAFINNPSTQSFTVTFAGEVLQGYLANPIPAQYSIRSSLVPEAGTVSALNLTPWTSNNDQLLRWIPSAQSYNYYTNSSGSWVPSTPSLNIGESFFINTGSATTWKRSFSVW